METHPKPFELEVQRAIHTLQPPYRGNQTMLVGLDDRGSIGAVVVSCPLPGAGLHKIRLLAVELGLRGTSDDPHLAGDVASETLDVMLSRLREDSPGGRVFGVVHRRNTGSLRLLVGHNFAHIPEMPAFDDDHQTWAANIPG